MDRSDKMLARKDGRVGTMIFNNPERHNAVSLEMWEAAAKILDDFVADEEIRVVILTGAGGKSFVSGADISKFEDERATREAVQAIKQISLEVLKPESERDLKRAANLVARCFDSQDYVEGRRAFLEKRNPVFTGK